MNEAGCCKTDRCTDDRWSQPTDDAEKDASQIGSFICVGSFQHIWMAQKK
jgi:hypothetical protein